MPANRGTAREDTRMKWLFEPLNREERLELYRMYLWAFIILLVAFCIGAANGFWHGLF